MILSIPQVLYYTLVTICKCNMSGSRCQSLPVIFSSTKRLIMLFDIANCYFLSYFFDALSLID